MSEDKRREESVVFDNMFHRNLTGVRNQGVQQNHPDIEKLVMEHHQQAKGALAQSTLYSMPAADRSEEQKVDFERSIQFDDKIPTIYNFRYVTQQLQKEVKRAEKFKRPLTIAIVGFKDLPSIYSNYGVLAQEEAYKFIGKGLVEFLDLDIDLVGKYETYRFLLVFPENPPEVAVKRFEQIRKYFEKASIQYHQYKFSLPASIGIVSVPHHGYSWKELIAKADLATDMVLEKGGNALGSC